MKICRTLCAIALLSLTLTPAWASLTPTGHFSAEPERARLYASFEARERVTRQLAELGIDRGRAEQRVAQMTDREIAGLQDRIGDLPAGAGMGTTNLLLIIIILILLL